MKYITFLLLLAACQFSFGQSDTNVIAIGDWSVPVTSGFYPLRGRLVICKPEPQDREEKKVGLWNGARVYVELQRVDSSGDPSYSPDAPMEIFIDGYLPMHAEMRDGHDKTILGIYGWSLMDAPIPPQFTVTLPHDSTLRLRASDGVGTGDPNALVIAVPEQGWKIIGGDTNEYYLSATFSPATNHPSCLNYYVWHGTLQLPKVKIPTENIKQ